MTDLFAPGIETSASISPCGLYRYQLTRRWNPGAYSLPIVMLNPSTADATADDPTIRRCMSFARRDGWGGVRVFNLFALRATDPKVMMAHPDPVGPQNDQSLEGMFIAATQRALPVLAAWGASGDHLDRARAVRALAGRVGASLRCLGTTKRRHPRHPLYVKGDQPMEPYA